MNTDAALAEAPGMHAMDLVYALRDHAPDSFEDYGTHAVTACPACKDFVTLHAATSQKLRVECDGGCAPEAVLRAAGVDAGGVALAGRPAVAPADAPLASVTPLPTAQAPRLRAYSLDDIAAEKRRIAWLIKGFWPRPSYGMVAGAEKTLKSWVTIAAALSVASGRPLFGRFEVPKSGPVLVFFGEGTRHLYWRRLGHLGRSLGLTDAELRALPIRVIDDVASIPTPSFGQTLRAELDESTPALVVLDSLYNWHGDGEAGNVHAEGQLLTALSKPTQEAGASLMVVNHFNKAGATHLALSSITQAGGREWSDSWALMKHRASPDLAAQRFALDLEVGTRHGFGRALRLDVDLGPFDEDTLTHLGVASMVASDAAREPEAATVEDLIVQALAAEPGLSQTDLASRVGRRKQAVAAALAQMVERGEVVREARAGKGGGFAYRLAEPGTAEERF